MLALNIICSIGQSTRKTRLNWPFKVRQGYFKQLVGFPEICIPRLIEQSILLILIEMIFLYTRNPRIL